MLNRRKKLLNFLILLVLPVFCVADSSVQRILFKKAELALQQGSQFQFKLLSMELKNYSLYPYLRYAELKQQIDYLPEYTVKEFLVKYKDTPLATKLRQAWLLSLAKQKNWLLFLKYYNSQENKPLACLYGRALWSTQELSLLKNTLSDVWLQADLSNPSCNTLFLDWKNSGNLDNAMLWQRIKLAFEKRDNNSLKVLSRWSPPELQTLINLWQQVRANPDLIRQANLFLPLDSNQKTILIDGFGLAIKKNPAQAISLWQQLKSIYSFDDKDQQTIQAMLAVALARNMDPAATSWLKLIQPAFVNKILQEWRIRTALREANWQEVLVWINQLPLAEQQTSVWRYWRARALDETGDQSTAAIIFQQLANQIDYYGLLSSQKLNQAYKPFIQSTIISTKDLDRFNHNLAIQRIHELYALNKLVDVRSEWQFAINKMDKTQLLIAAQFAKQNHWYDRAIIAAAKAGAFRNLDLRYPIPYRQQVIAAAEKTKLDPAWIYGIMRQESFFMTDAKSPVGALGLMQLMPQTAKWLWKDLLPHHLLNADMNIELGSRYLQYLYQMFNANISIATAAYNAGPTRILKKYFPLYKQLPADVWVEILPWQETRDYVKQVTLNMAVYQLLLK